jgi:hypothetical protein
MYIGEFASGGAEFALGAHVTFFASPSAIVGLIFS